MFSGEDIENFVKYVNRSLDEEEDFHFLRFEFLQRLNLTQFQARLVRLKSRIQKEGKASRRELKMLQSTMSAYATAIRDYRCLRLQKSLGISETKRRKLLLQRFFQSESDFNDPFQSHYAFFKDDNKKIDPLRRAFMTSLPARLAYSDEERRQRSREYAEGKYPLRVSQFMDRLLRFTVALAGGVFLIMPMIITMLNPSQMKSLVTASVAVVFFAVVLSFAVRASNAETLIWTATYAAVLVVFVGTSAGASSN
ncbi:hypothetical protein B0T26DRAFT_658545 [Lasiosphaeria miniovina]|uniref:DUF6594 domain-containing protein n=1 Tax=Lasiosphaeria miniovina TaxID=1954250 RepID=A0AA39ZUZ7_9PEZI|nr:uncharacterized protein B0T26DRAFT_658545 [Lasiosphaeria miniovina]KAK0704019.1 hypothetical protein B0T26DRAFT_658545 [Lasiosphaeria miniovina]